MNRLSEAVEDYREALMQEPNSKEAQSKLATAEEKIKSGNGSM